MCLLCSAQLNVYIYLFVYYGCSRKVGISMWKEGQRRSPRISALDACKAQQSRRVGRTALALLPQPQAMSLQEKKTQGPASRTRASTRKIRKLRPLEDVAATPISPFAQQVLFICSPFSFSFFFMAMNLNDSSNQTIKNRVFLFTYVQVFIDFFVYGGF